MATPYTGETSGGATTSNVAAPLRDETAMYYGADDRLRVVDRRSCLYFGVSQTALACDTMRPPAYEKRSSFEEYRYDALGRRVLVRTRSEHACNQYCLNTLRRTVWDGDQVLYEISAPGGSSATAPQMEADTGLAVPFFLNQQHTAVTGFFPYGRVMYEHGGGIDAPLGVVRMEYSSELRDPQVIVPLNDWRGTYDRGTTIVGSCILFNSNGTQLAPPPDSTPSSADQYGGVVGGGTYGGTKTHCVDVDWPGAYTWSARQYRRGYSGPDSWMGSLIFESRDASGLYYRRNRYYDSEKGRFTQEDPIGLAGGINVYGFAGGDPITYGDPYGLCPPISSCLAGHGPRRSLEIASLRKGERRHYTVPTDVVLTATAETSVRAGFNDAGQLIVFMQGGLKIDSHYLPEGAERIPINYVALNVDTGEFDVWGASALNFITVAVQGNFRTGSSQAKVCFGWVKCTIEIQGPQAQEDASPSND